MFAASRFGQTNRFAEPCSVLSGRMVLRRPSSRALSPCISPSTSSSGARSRSSASACRIFSADGASELPKLECDSSATLGSTPKRRTASAAIVVISAICSAVGSRLTWVSTRNT